MVQLSSAMRGVPFYPVVIRGPSVEGALRERHAAPSASSQAGARKRPILREARITNAKISAVAIHSSTRQPPLRLRLCSAALRATTIKHTASSARNSHALGWRPDCARLSALWTSVQRPSEEQVVLAY